MFSALDGDAVKVGGGAVLPALPALPRGCQVSKFYATCTECWLPAGIFPTLSREVQALMLSPPADLTSNQWTFLLQILKLPPSVFGKETPAKLRVMPLGHLGAWEPSRAILRTARNPEDPFLTNHVDRLRHACIILSHRRPFNYECINGASFIFQGRKTIRLK